MKQTRSTRRLAQTLALLGAGTLAALAGAAEVRAQQAASATPLGTFGNWAAFTSQDGSKICYVISQPQRREPENLNRDPGYLFVTFRPSENVTNEIAVTVGFPTAADQVTTGTVDGTNFNFITRGENVFLQDRAAEEQLVQAFIRGRSFELNIRSARGNDTRDIYSLSGFTAAINRARQECGVS